MKLRVTIRDQDQLDAFVDRFNKMPIPERGWSVEVDEFKNNRSLAQNRFLWDQVYQPMAEQVSDATETLVKKDHIHKLMLDRFSPREIMKVLGETICTPKSTTKFTKQEMSDYMEKCFAWGTEHGVWFNS